MGTRYNRLTEAVLTCTHNLCFGAKIRKLYTPVNPQFYCIKVGCKGVLITRTCYPDGHCDKRPYKNTHFIYSDRRLLMMHEIATFIQ